MLAVDDAYAGPNYGNDVVRNATALDAMTTGIWLYSNLRVLLKSFSYVQERAEVNRHLLWTIWHLEIVSQIDPRFRADLRLLASEIEKLIVACYQSVATVPFVVEPLGIRVRCKYSTDKGRTMFAIFRSYFWEHARARLSELDGAVDPESKKQTDVLRALLADSRRTDFVILLCMLPFKNAPAPKEFLTVGEGRKVNPFERDLNKGLHHQLAYLIAN